MGLDSIWVAAGTNTAANVEGSEFNGVCRGMLSAPTGNNSFRGYV